MPKNVVIVGMARSGTSFTASIFAKLGYFVAIDPESELEGGNKYNPGGYWESSRLVQNNTEVLKAVNFNCHNTWTSDEINDGQADQIATLQHEYSHKEFLRQYNAHQPWMWKDPRLCYTLGYWWPLMDRETTGILLLTREPEEIYRSFLRIKWQKGIFNDKEAFIRRINDHIKFAKWCISKKDIPHIEIDYSDYATQPDETARKLSEFFDIRIQGHKLGYEKKYNHSSTNGLLEYWSETFVSSLPPIARTFLKKYTPAFLQRLVAPSRQ